VFSSEGIGTLIYGNEYKQIRPARKKDKLPARGLSLFGLPLGRRDEYDAVGSIYSKVMKR
jgi:hypothetical protein